MVDGERYKGWRGKGREVGIEEWTTGLSTGAWRERAGVLRCAVGSCITHHDRREGRIAWWLSASMGMARSACVTLILGPAPPKPDASLDHSHTSPQRNSFVHAGSCSS